MALIMVNYRPEQPEQPEQCLVTPQISIFSERNNDELPESVVDFVCFLSLDDRIIYNV